MIRRIEELSQGRYPGGKNAPGTWQWIVAKMPSHSIYCEPFAGSFAVGRRKPPALRSIAIDSDPQVVRYLRTLPGVEVLRTCGVNWLRANRGVLGPDALVYCDPPYVLSTRTKRRIYDHEWTDDQHDQFLRIVTSLRCAVMVSGYPSKLYDAHLHMKFTRHEIDVMTRGGKRREILWCNWSTAKGKFFWGDPITPAAAWRPGDGWRERQRIERLVKRWLANYSRRPPQERRAILEALLAARNA